MLCNFLTSLFILIFIRKQDTKILKYRGLSPDTLGGPIQGGGGWGVEADTFDWPIYGGGGGGGFNAGLKKISIEFLLK